LTLWIEFWLMMQVLDLWFNLCTFERNYAFSFSETYGVQNNR
jgi:hypothetical protein